MALQDLNRTSDTTGDGQTGIDAPTTNALAEITPKNWHKFPPAIANPTQALANANAAKPRYGTAGDWALGVPGDDTDTAKATVALARSDGGAAEADYTPRTQAAKATAMSTTLAVDVARPRGWIEPADPYQGKGSAPVAPVVTSISPTTGAAAALQMRVVITGTGFTPWSTVRTGGSATPDVSGKYISATQMEVAIWKASAGTVSVAVEDHDLLSNVDKVFTVT
jgi:hypothetical protein